MKKREQLQQIVEDLLYLFPMIKHKFIETHNQENPDVKLRHFPILSMLKRCGKVNMSEIAKHFYLSKPHLSMLVNEFIEEGLVQRIPSQDDRRIVYLELTKKGVQVLDERTSQLQETMRSRLTSLSEHDIETLADCAANMKKIISKIATEENKV